MCVTNVQTMNNLFHILSKKVHIHTHIHAHTNKFACRGISKQIHPTIFFISLIFSRLKKNTNSFPKNKLYEF